MIDIYSKEFLAIVKHLKKVEEVRKKGDFIIVDKCLLIEMLDKNAYETSDKKLRIWKGLQWIVTDENKLTKRVWSSDMKKQIPMIQINLLVYETLNQISEK